MRLPFLRSAASLACLCALWLGSVAPAAAQDPSRFSQTLSAAERADCALTKLSSDQVAVIDALVRRDTAARSGAVAPESPAAFSQRLTADERRTAGIASLGATEIAKLDAFVERYQSGRLARTLLAAPLFLRPGPAPLRESDTRKPKERGLHGTFSFSLGWGSGGYSEKTGAMSVTLDDPAKNYSITIGYIESHVKGGPMIYRDPYYDLRPSQIDDPLRP